MSRWPSKTFTERFWEKVNRSDECWLWPGAHNPHGYGVFFVGGATRQQLAHRTAWRLAFGPIPAGSLVLHKCDIRNCVRPDHLFLGTQRTNMRDMLYKGRGMTQKLTTEDVLLIRDSEEKSGILAARYGVRPQTIWGIRARRTWTHLCV